MTNNKWKKNLSTCKKANLWAFEKKTLFAILGGSKEVISSTQATLQESLFKQWIMHFNWKSVSHHWNIKFELKSFFLDKLLVSLGNSSASTFKNTVQSIFLVMTQKGNDLVDIGHNCSFNINASAISRNNDI